MELGQFPNIAKTEEIALCKQELFWTVRLRLGQIFGGLDMPI
jgi:hypothetical protein